MAVTLEELKASITELRARRLAIPELRDYKPQSRKSAKASKPDVPIEDTFADLLTRGNQSSEGGEVE